MSIIKLERSYAPDDSCTIGKLTLPCGYTCLTIERPWLDNMINASCIPEGVYSLSQRQSGVVKRTTGGEFTSGWEVCDVVGRAYIMIHPGNWAKDTEGCILPGQSFASHPEHGLMVTDSRKTYRNLMSKLEARDKWTLQITNKRGGTHA